MLFFPTTILALIDIRHIDLRLHQLCPDYVFLVVLPRSVSQISGTDSCLLNSVQSVFCLLYWFILICTDSLHFLLLTNIPMLLCHCHYSTICIINQIMSCSLWLFRLDVILNHRLYMVKLWHHISEQHSTQSVLWISATFRLPDQSLTCLVRQKAQRSCCSSSLTTLVTCSLRPLTCDRATSEDLSDSV